MANAWFLQGDARAIPLRDGSVQCVVTSPPYWGLRDYGLPPLVWGGEAACEHEWAKPIEGSSRSGSLQGSILEGAPPGTERRPQWTSAFCLHCSAWRGSLGLEPTPDLFVAHLVEIFREVWRVLRKDGVLWLNLGDSYFGDSPVRKTSAEAFSETWDPGQTRSRGGNRRSAARWEGSKPKDLVLMPARVALALQADGWWVRSDIIWSKPNPMPESVTDRPTKSHEYLFLLSKSARYYYDPEPIKEPQEEQERTRRIREQEQGLDTHYKIARDEHHVGQAPHGKEGVARSVAARHALALLGIRNRRTVWEIATEPFPEAHFATFPQALVEPCVLAGTSERGACARCGAPSERVTETQYRKHRPSAGDDPRSRNEDKLSDARGDGGWRGNNLLADVKTTGWEPGCECGAETRPCIVLDPFCGAGTAVLVAQRLGRAGVGLDLKGEYLRMGRERTRQQVIL